MGIISGIANAAGGLIRRSNPKGHERISYEAKYDTNTGEEISNIQTVISDKKPTRPSVPIKHRLDNAMKKHNELSRNLLGMGEEATGEYSSNNALTLTSKEKDAGVSRTVKHKTNALNKEASRVPFAKRKDNGMDVEGMFTGESVSMGGIKGRKGNPMKGKNYGGLKL